MDNLLVTETNLRAPCETFRCNNRVQYKIGKERAPGTIAIFMCESCLKDIIRNSPKKLFDEVLVEKGLNVEHDILLKENEELKQSIETLNQSIASLTSKLEEKSEEKSEEKPEEKPEEKLSKQTCDTCFYQANVKTKDPCKSCEKDDKLIHFTKKG